MNKLQIQYIDAEAAAGKSKYACQLAIQSAINNEKVVIAVPTELLANQYKSYIPNTIKCRVIMGPGSIKNLSDHLQYTYRNTGEILIISHVNLIQTEHWFLKESWNLIIDETLSVTNDRSISLPNTSQVLTDIVEGDIDFSISKLYRLRVKKGVDIKNLLTNKYRDEVLSLSSIRNILIDLNLSDRYELYGWVEQWTKVLNQQFDPNDNSNTTRFPIYSILDPSFLKGFKMILVLSANFTDSLMYVTWKNKVEFINQSYIFTRQNYIPRDYSKVNIISLCKRIPSKYWLNQEHEEHGSVKNQLLKYINDLLMQNPYGLIMNKGTIHQLYNAVDIPITCHGLNSYQHLDDIVYIAAINPTPQFAEFLEYKFTIGRNILQKIIYHQVVYQGIMRGSLRDPSKDNIKRNIIVIDDAVADYLKTQLMNATVTHCNLEIHTKEKEKPGPKESCNTKSRAQIQKEYRNRKKLT